MSEPGYARFPEALVRRALLQTESIGVGYAMVPDECAVMLEATFLPVTATLCGGESHVPWYALTLVCLLPWMHEGSCGWARVVDVAYAL